LTTPLDAQLRDIHVIFGWPWWPPAPGWWLLLALGLLLAGLAWRFRATWRLHLPIPLVTLGDWRWDAGRALRRLRRAAAQDTGSVKAAAAEFSELLRRIAMARHGRGGCAGLSDEAWLEWLTAHDPKGFDWHRHGRLLLTAPYAPTAAVAARRAELGTLIAAAEPWITARPPKAVGTADRRRWWRRSPGPRRRQRDRRSAADRARRAPAA
jgi:hypothetical protein